MTRSSPTAAEGAAPAPLAILGPYPPPSGGVTTHVERLSALLAARGVDHTIYNVGSDAARPPRVVSVYRQRRTWLARYLLRGREPAVYVVSPRLEAWAFAAALARLRGRRVAIRIQNNRIVELARAGGAAARLAGAALRQVDAVVCVNRHIVQAVAALGVRRERIVWSPGFLPPPGDPTAARGEVDDAVWRLAARCRPLVVGNGKIATYAGADLYGFDLLVELIARLRGGGHPGAGLVVCLYGVDSEEDRAAIERLRRRAAALGVGEAVLFNERPGPFLPVLAEAADVFVRPTNTDGDANSLREALWLGVPSVASDVVERPAGARLFRNRDVEDLVRAVEAALVSGADADADADADAGSDSDSDSGPDSDSVSVSVSVSDWGSVSVSDADAGADADAGDGSDAERVRRYLDLLERLARG